MKYPLQITRVLPATLGVLALTVATVSLVPGSANAIEPTDEPEDFSVERSDVDPELLSGLDSELDSASVSTVVDSANRTAEDCDAPADNLVASFCWQSGDGNVEYWMPQGLSSTADAATGGSYDGKEVLLAAWYDNTTGADDRGIRVSFIDMSDPSAPVYRHVLLVEPSGTPEEPSFEAIDAHAGGLVWYGDQLYVCDTFNGWRVFDFNRIMEMPSLDDEMGRQPDGGYAARGYAYAMPQVATYVPDNSDTVDLLRYSQVSLDRTSTPESLVVSEWEGDTGDGTRIVRFDVDGNGDVIPDEDGIGRADWAEIVSFRSMQGAAAVNGTYYVHRSNGASKPGDVIKWTPGDTAEIFDGALPVGPEDVSYWGDRDELWNQTEYAGERYIFATRLSAW